MNRYIVCSTLGLCALTMVNTAFAQGEPDPAEPPADAAEEAAPEEETDETEAVAETPPPAPEEEAMLPPEPPPPPPAGDPDMMAPPSGGMPGDGSQEFEDLDLGELLNMRVENTFVASRKLEGIDGAPAVVTVIGSEELRRAGIRTVSEALARVPGFYPTRQFFHDDLLGVRGYQFHTNDKIVLLMDGHNISRSGWTQVMTGDLDEVNSLEKVERIEIIHGPGSIVWGDNALFTAINIVTKSPKTTDGTTATVRYGRHLGGSACGDLEVCNNYVANIQYGKQFTEDAGILLNFNLPIIEGWVSEDYGTWFQYSPRGDYVVDDFDSKFKSYEFYAKAEVHDWRIWFRAMNPHQRGAMSQYNVEPGSGDLTWRPYQEQQDFSLQNYNMVAEKQFDISDDLKMHFKAGFDKYIFNGAFSFGPGQYSCDQTDPGYPDNCSPGPGGLGPLFYMHQDNNALSASLSGEYTGVENNTLLAGLDFVHGQYGDSRAVPVDPELGIQGGSAIRTPGGAEYTSAVWIPGNDRTVSGYLQDQWRIIDQLELFAGTRVEWNQPRSDGDVVFSPRGGVITRPMGDDSILVKYSFNTGYRRANWWQHQWPLGLFGNYFELVADKPEFSQNHDIQLIWNATDDIKLNAVYWFLKAEDMIFAANTASGGNPNWVNAGNFASDGLELKFDWQFMDRNIAGMNATWTRKNEFTTSVPTFDTEAFVNADGRYLNYPEIQATAFTNFLFENGLFVDLTLRYMTKIPGREPDDEFGQLATIEDGVNHEVTVNNIYYVDAAVGSKDLGVEGLELTLRGLNLLNNRKRIPRGQGDHDLYQPAPTYAEIQLSYNF